MKSLSICLITLAFLGAFGIASAEDDPNWSDLNELFGKEISSLEVTAFVEQHDLKKGAKGDSGSFRPKHNAYSLMFNHNRISTIILQVAPWPENFGGAHWRTYSNELPCGIKPENKEKDLIAMFGKSHTKQGHSWIADDLDIWVHFREDGSISALYISKQKD